MSSTKLFTIKFEACDIPSEIRNIDPEEYSLIVFIKDVKQCIANENEEVQLYPGEQIKVEARSANGEGNYVIASDEEMMFVFEEYRKVGQQIIQMYVEFIPVQSRSPRPLLPSHSQPNTEPTEPNSPNTQPTEPNSPNTQPIESSDEGEEFTQHDDDFHWSDASHEDETVSHAEVEIMSESGEDDDETRGLNYKSDNGDGESDEGEDDGATRLARHMKGKAFKKCADGKIYFEVGHVFDSVEHFRGVLKDYTVDRGFATKKIYNEKRRIKVVCRSEGCPFHLYAALMVDGQSYQIRQYEHTHTCLRVHDNPAASASWVAEKFGRFIRSQEGSSIKPLASQLEQEHFLKINHRKLYRVKKIATGLSAKEHAESYNWLFKYCHIVLMTNAGSKAALKVIRDEIPSTPRFHRFFLSFAAQKKDFLEGCRRFIGVDGCHLKGHFGGVLLSAVAIDANSGIFPLAICVCEVENNDSWGYFLGMLKEFMGDVLPITFMSDRQKGIIHALQTQWPNAKSRFCARHVYANFRKTFPGVHLRNLFWAISRASNKVDFHEALNKMKAVDETAYKWVIDNEPDQWSRFGFDTEAKSDHITNNMSETFNSWLGEGRELPILSLLELYRRRIMKRLYSRLKAGTEWVTPLPPLVVKKLNKSIETARNVSISYAGLQEFEVIDMNGIPSRTYTLNLDKRICDCGMWQLSRIPCQHAICSILHMNFPTIDKFVDDRLQISAYMRTYAEIIHPIPDKRTWPEECEDKLQPSVRHGKAGRPRKARRKDPTEERKRKPVSTLRCSHCHELGHNKRSCQYNPNNAGRPKKKRRTIPTMESQSAKSQFGSSSSSQHPSSQHPESQMQ
ncbi:uncharacterized protein LOC123226047 [Mangifera indica]|uniref:uncharacterized protein LOC123226047 n=1 Tax=Mangifera indica TaxID=29780 RepID=UPI001CF9C23C|nr:uncharacterized protein LOC123226047 [Mangifera indica]